MNPDNLNGQALAYIGDVYYEYVIRHHLMTTAHGKVNDVHKKATAYTSGIAQTRIMKALLEDDFLNEQEITFFKRGRNVKQTSRRSGSKEARTMSTGFEALIGYLCLTEQFERAKVIIHKAMAMVD